MIIKHETKLLALLSLPVLRQEELLIATELVGQIDQRIFMELARWHRVLPSVYKNIKNHFSDCFDKDQIEDLQTHYLKNMSECNRQLAAISELSDVFKRAGIKFKVIKGIPLAYKLYGSPHFRYARDIDILIDGAQLASVCNIFETQGYKSKFNDLEPYQQKIYLGTHKDITFTRVSGEIVELHIRLSEYSSLFSDVITAELLSGSDRANVDQYAFIYYCWHGAHTMFHRLKWLADLAQFCRVCQWEEEEWVSAIQFANKLGVARCLTLSCALLSYVYNEQFPKNIEENMKRSFLVKVMLFVCKNNLNERNYFNRASSKIYIHILEMLLFSRTSDKIEVLRHNFRPTLVDLCVLPAIPRRLSFLYLLLRPFRFFYSQIFLSAKDVQRRIYASSK